MEQRLQPKLKGNTSANLHFSGIEFQSVFVSGENVQALVRICQRAAKAFIWFLLIIVTICSENTVSVFDILLTIKFSNEVTCWVSYVNLIDSLNG